MEHEKYSEMAVGSFENFPTIPQLQGMGVTRKLSRGEHQLFSFLHKNEKTVNFCKFSALRTKL